MLNTLRRSFGMSASSNDLVGLAGSPRSADMSSPSNRPNTFVPLRRTNSFTNLFSSSRPSSPVPAQVQESHAAASSSSATTSQSGHVLAYLVLLDKKGRHKERFPIQSRVTTMGRSIDNDVRFLVSEVSRHHCSIEIEIEQTGSQAYLRVLGASGVLLNGKHVLPTSSSTARIQLSSGESIVIARRSFLFELNESAPVSNEPHLFASPTKASLTQSPGKKTRRVRMSLVNSAQVDTPARQPQRSSSPAKSPNKALLERDARRAAGMNKFMLSAKLDTKAKSGRRSLTPSSVGANPFSTPVKTKAAVEIPKTAPPKQVSFSLYSTGHSRPLSPVKQIQMMPPLDTMVEEQDTSSNDLVPQSPLIEKETEVVQEEEDSAEDIVIVEELETHEADSSSAAPAQTSPTKDEHASPTPSPTSGSPKRAKRRSSFFGRAGPFSGISLGFYAEERSDPAPVEPEYTLPAAAEEEDVFSDAPMAASAVPEVDAASPPQRPRTYGMSKTPSPTKGKHFAGLTPIARRPRLSLTTRRRVSLRTQTLLRSSEAYADRLFLPPPPSSLRNSLGGMTKSSSMPSDLSRHTLETSEECEEPEEEQARETDFEAESQLQEEEEAQPWRDTEEDEDEVDQSLSLLESPVRTPCLGAFATPQPLSRANVQRRASLPLTLPATAPSLVGLQINGLGERVLISTTSVVEATPAKSKKMIRVSDVGLPATDVSMGYDVVQQEGEQIAEALDDLFHAEEDQLTDEEDAEDEEQEEEEEIVQVAVPRTRASPVKSVPIAEPSTPAALNSLRHLFSSSTAVPATPDMSGLGSMLHSTSSPEKPQYGTLYDRMRASADMVQLMSPLPSKTSSPRKPRSSVRRSQAAESPAAAPLPSSPAPTQTVLALPYEAELHVTLFSETEAEPEHDSSIPHQHEDEAAETSVVIHEDETAPLADASVDTSEPVPAQLHQATVEESVPQEAAVDEAIALEAAAHESVADHAPAEEASASDVVPDAVLSEASIVQQEAVTTSPIKVETEPTTSSPWKAARRTSPTKAAASPSKTAASPVKASRAAVSPTKVAVRADISPKKSTSPKKVTAVSPLKTSALVNVSPVKTRRAIASPVKVEVNHASPAKAAGESEEAPIANDQDTREATAELEFEVAGTKPKRATRAKQSKQTQSPEDQENLEEPAAIEIEAAQSSSPVKATRTRTRTVAAPPAPVTKRTTRAATATRSTRTRKATDDASDIPSSSAAFGDDEATDQEQEAALPSKTTTTTKRTARTTTRKVQDSIAPPSSSPTKTVVARKTRAKTTKATPQQVSESHDDETAASSTSTTRSGRPRRAAAAK